MSEKFFTKGAVVQVVEDHNPNGYDYIGKAGTVLHIAVHQGRRYYGVLLTGDTRLSFFDADELEAI